jgi:hypothetical protein
MQKSNSKFQLDFKIQIWKFQFKNQVSNLNSNSNPPIQNFKQNQNSNFQIQFKIQIPDCLQISESKFGFKIPIHNSESHMACQPITAVLWSALLWLVQYITEVGELPSVDHVPPCNWGGILKQKIPSFFHTKYDKDDNTTILSPELYQNTALKTQIWNSKQNSNLKFQFKIPIINSIQSSDSELQFKFTFQNCNSKLRFKIAIQNLNLKLNAIQNLNSKLNLNLKLQFKIAIQRLK